MSLTESTTYALEFLHPDCDDVALIDGDSALTHAELAIRVLTRADEFRLPSRSVVVLTGSPSIEYVVSYLAIRQAGHVPLLAGSHVDALVERWCPGAVVAVETDEVSVTHREAPSVELHPDLALLLSTSGSTGSPKLVRLSHENLVSNARSIAEYLSLGPGDRGITSLPLHYCYGLSVLHSHLLVGAGVVLTELSVVDPCFADAMRRHDVTNLAGVPHTFELLDRAGAERIRVPSLRFVTQAGGRLAPERVRRWRSVLARWGVDLFVMYGQTEATARMAYLPPDLAERHPAAIGIAIPDGELTLRPVDGAAAGVGELVYRGPNVMLGYADHRDDLALGRVTHELATGDLGRFDPADGVFEVVGRRSRFVKPFGLRIDLDAVEAAVRRSGVDEVAVAGDDDGIVVRVTGADQAVVRATVVDATGLPPAAVSVGVRAHIERTSAGKVDYDAIRRSAVTPGIDPAGDPVAERVLTSDRIRDLYRTVLGRSDIEPTDTFVGLGGDSLSYVECSIRLESILGRVPTDWHLRPIAELEVGTQRRWLPPLDTTVVFRALSICLIVSTHMRVHYFPGGAHLLLAVVGFNLSRFTMPIESTRDRTIAGLRSVGRVVAPTLAWVAIGMACFGAYGLGTLLLVNNYAGPAHHDADLWHFWFIEVMAQIVLVTVLVLAIPAVRRLERRHRYWFPFAAVAASLLLRLEIFEMHDWYNLRYRSHGILWFFLLGWLVQRSDSTRQRLLTTGLCIVTVSPLIAPGFFDNSTREWFITTCLVVLTWCREIPLPRPLVAPIGVIASASMWILITHFTVWPLLTDVTERRLAYVLTIAAGVAVWAIGQAASRQVRRVRDARAGATAGELEPAVRIA